MLSQLNFADFLRSPGGNDEGNGGDPMNFNFIPPTPQDRFPQHSFASHEFLVTPISTENNMFGRPDSPRAREIGSPPPPLGGIFAPETVSPHIATRSVSLRAPSHHSRSSSVASSTTSIRHEPYKNASRRTSASSFSSVGHGSAYSIGNHSDTSATGLAARLSIVGGSESVVPLPTSMPISSLSALNTGCIDQSAMMSLCPGEMMQPMMAHGSMTTSNGETVQLQTPWTAQQLTDDMSDEDDQSDDADEDAEGEIEEEDVMPRPRRQVATVSAADASSDESEDSGSEYAEESDDEVPAAKAKQAGPPTTSIRRTVARTKPKPVMHREHEPILVTAITASGKKSHARKRPIDHIPRPRNAFILFRKHVVDSKLIPPEVEIRHQNISVVVSKMWAEADKDTKFSFQEQARKEKEEHMRNHPDYKYQPVYRRASVARRKLKVDPVEEKKCEVVASLLIEGKQGEELEEGASKAVKAADRKRMVQAAKLQALRKSASQNSLRREKAAAAKTKKTPPFGQPNAVSSTRSSPAPAANEDLLRAKSTLFPLAEQLLQSSSIVIQGQKAVEQAQLEGHRRASSSISSMRDMLPSGSQTATTYSTPMATAQTHNGMMQHSTVSNVVYQPQQQMQYLAMEQQQQQAQQHFPQQQQQSQQHYVMPQQYQYIQAPIQHQQQVQHAQSDHSQVFINHRQHGSQAFDPAGAQFIVANAQSQSHGASQQASHTHDENEPPSHYVLQLLSQNQGMGMGAHNLTQVELGNLQVMPAGQGMYEMEMSGYSEALAQMGVYGSMQG